MPRLPSRLPSTLRQHTTSPRPLFFLSSAGTASQTRSFRMSDSINRNPHPDFKKVEGSRPDWDASSQFRYTKTAAPHWKWGQGTNLLETAADKSKQAVAIDPHAEGRPGAFNYKLLISAIVPRPVAFVSTRSADGKTTNLAPFSYFNVMTHDPPIFVVGFASPVDAAKDSLRNLLDTKECVVNIISEPFVEAANSSSIDAPFGSSEWAVSGLTAAYDTQTVKCARVKEAVFSIECKLDMVKEWDSKAKPGTKSGTMAVLEGTRFWVREDALNEDQNMVDPEVLRPISRLGGITYGRLTEAFELPRPKFEEDLGGKEGFEKLDNKD